MPYRNFRFAIAAFASATLLSLTACGSDETAINHYTNVLESKGFTDVERWAGNHPSILRLEAAVPCDNKETLPIFFKINAAEDQVNWVMLFDERIEDLPDGTDANDIEVDDLRRLTKELGLQNCLYEEDPSTSN